ncbi:alpha/beta hydrolase [Bacteroides sp. 51]|uniref:alpha/beta hydrolase n=1 Tax=Bacteroides sp. 51 TaxID=2302938 RepID=UPI0013D4D7E8|nr:alpha/beta hydrolase [Bacteroides sp. 51]NDV81185.1 alpha/beta hydrolase [Bacteroides sp. 51]
MKKVIYSILILFVVFIAISFGGGLYLIDYALVSNSSGKNIVESYHYMEKTYPFVDEWLDSLQQTNALKDTTITNRKGKQLHAYYVAASQPTAKTAVIVHGYTDNAIRIMQIGYMYSHDLSYNILLPDLQNHGLSEGEAIQMGWKDRLDVLQWMEMANQIYGDSARMVVHGISMGAATTMMVSGEQQEDYVKCFVEDCGYTSVWDEFSQELEVQFSLPEFPLLHAASWLCKQKYGWDFKEASALNQVKKCSLPMFFIHGDADTYVPTWMVYPLYEAKPDPKELWIVPGAAHAAAYKDNKEEYTARVKAFVDKYI